MPINLFLKLDKIEGQSTVEKFEKQIEVLSASHGVSHHLSRDVSNQARTISRPNHQDFSFTKVMDMTSPELQEYCSKGEDVDKATLTVTHSGGKGEQVPLWVVTMEKAVITSVSLGGGGGGIPSESFTINYSTVKWEFKQQKTDVSPGGTAATGWDQTKNAVLGK